jgi:hypothetical protein
MKLRPRAGFIARLACTVPTWTAAQCRAWPTAARLHRATTHAQRAHAAHGLTSPRCMWLSNAGSAHALPRVVALHRWHGGKRRHKRWCKGSGEAHTSAQGGVDGMARRRARRSYGFWRWRPTHGGADGELWPVPERKTAAGALQLSDSRCFSEAPAWRRALVEREEDGEQRRPMRRENNGVASTPGRRKNNKRASPRRRRQF